MADPQAIVERHLRRVLAQPRRDPRTGDVRPPTLREAEDQIRRVVQQSDAEKREGRKPTQAKAAEPETVRDVREMGGEFWAGDGHAPVKADDDVRSRAGGSYADRYELIDWSK